jgi:hypothetical protein
VWASEKIWTFGEKCLAPAGIRTPSMVRPVAWSLSTACSSVTYFEMNPFHHQQSSPTPAVSRWGDLAVSALSFLMISFFRRRVMRSEYPVFYKSIIYRANRKEI